MTRTVRDVENPGGTDGLTQCWCCTSREADDRMVHLGTHPEVAVCVRCAHSLSKWAWEVEDRDKTGPGVAARNGFRKIRARVIRRGWHRSPVFGRWIRWVGKHLP
jgi:hypothetical protein